MQIFVNVKHTVKHLERVCLKCCVFCIKGIVSRDFLPLIFYGSNLPSPLSHILKPFHFDFEFAKILKTEYHSVNWPTVQIDFFEARNSVKLGSYKLE
jgi:hypothetical protein